MSADTFPAPPDDVLQGPGTVSPALDVEAWVLDTVLDEDGALYNPDHGHLAEGAARVAFLWCSDRYAKNGRVVLGTCQLGPPRGNAWNVARQRDQLETWFGAVPDFLVTLDARFFAGALAADRAAPALAVVEHELYHAAQKTDRYGDPAFDPDGRPVWAVRGHDVEEFVGVVRRYGLDTPGIRPMAAAIDHVREHGPDVVQATIDGLCGTCKQPVA